MAAMTGSRSRLVMLPLPQDDPRQRRPDLGRAKVELDWQPSTALRDGLERTIAYFRHLLDRAPVSARPELVEAPVPRRAAR